MDPERGREIKERETNTVKLPWYHPATALTSALEIQLTLTVPGAEFASHRAPSWQELLIFQPTLPNQCRLHNLASSPYRHITVLLFFMAESIWLGSAV